MEEGSPCLKIAIFNFHCPDQSLVVGEFLHTWLCSEEVQAYSSVLQKSVKVEAVFFTLSKLLFSLMRSPLLLLGENSNYNFIQLKIQFY